MKNVLSFDDSLFEKAKTKGEKYKGKHIPSKYLTRKPKEMKKEIDEFRGKDKYKTEWTADFDERGDKRIKTKKSSATNAYKKMFKEDNSLTNIDSYEEFTLNEASEGSVDTKGSNANDALKNKSEDSGISMSILKQVYKRGMAAWNSGHRPGVAQQQWALGRVNSFITGVGGARKADVDLWKKAKEQKKKKSEK